MENNNTVCSTLNGIMAVKHPTLGVLVREDGFVFNKVNGGNSNAYGWTNGSLEQNGYRRVGIRGKNYQVHRLVAETFIPNPENKPTVDHINRVRDDNRVKNLRWATRKEQVENSGNVLNRVDYGVRFCENALEYSREYNKAHKDEQIEYSREYNKAHKEERREYRKAHKDEKREYDREYRKAHKEAIREYKREYYRKKRQEKLATKTLL